VFILLLALSAIAGLAIELAQFRFGVVSAEVI
jgi:hypothetical protein